MTQIFLTLPCYFWSSSMFKITYIYIYESSLLSSSSFPIYNNIRKDQTRYGCISDNLEGDRMVDKMRQSLLDG